MLTMNEEEGTIFNISFDPKYTQQLVHLDLVDPDGNIKVLYNNNRYNTDDSM